MFSKASCNVNRFFFRFVKPTVIRCRLKSHCLNQNFAKHRVTPDVMTDPPNHLLKVTYPGGLEVKQGNELKPRQVKTEPDVTWKYDKRCLYTLCMIDPDAPTRKDPKLREWLHWLVCNIPCDEVFRGQVLAQYLGAGPPKDTGLHRYVFIVYKQPTRLKFRRKFVSNKSVVGREKFVTRKFAILYKFCKPAVAANFFQAQYDDYVPEFYKKLGL